MACGWTIALTKRSINSPLNQVVEVSWVIYDRCLPVGLWWWSIQAGCQEELWKVRQYKQAFDCAIVMTKTLSPGLQSNPHRVSSEFVTLCSESHCAFCVAFMESGLFKVLVDTNVGLQWSMCDILDYGSPPLQCANTGSDSEEEWQRASSRCSLGAATESIWIFILLLKNLWNISLKLFCLLTPMLKKKKKNGFKVNWLQISQPWNGDF